MRIHQSLALAAVISIGLANAAFAAPGSSRSFVLPPPRLNGPAAPIGAPGMDNGIGYGVGNGPASPGLVRGADVNGAGVGTNPALQGGLGAGTGMVPKPVGQGF